MRRHLFSNGFTAPGTLALGLALVLGLAGCGDDSGTRTDAGMDGSSDTGTGDTGTVDTGSGDTGSLDTGVDDSGAGDAMTDSGAGDAMTDSGAGDAMTDSGTADTGTADTGTADTGTADTGAMDSGTADTGAMDSGTADTGTMDSGTGPAAPAAGEVLVTEIMQNPSTLADSAGEWFELYNPSATASYDLMGCTITGLTDAGILIDTSLVIGPGAYLTFAASMDPGFVPDVVWTAGSFSLTNSSDSVRMTCPDGAGGSPVVDEVVYDNGATFPDPNGASMQLGNTHLDATQNDVGYNWCEGMTSYNGDLGTPGAANEACPSYTLGFCRLQFPETISDVEGSAQTVYGRVYIAGLTDVTTTGNDPSPEVRAELGVGPDATDPATDATWTWTSAFPNSGYTGAEMNNDEYQSDLTVPPAVGGAATQYDYAYRFSADRGRTWVYCDARPEGSSDGYQMANAGQLTARPAAAPTGNLFFSEYVEGSSSNKALEIVNLGTAAADLASCSVRRYSNGSATVSATQSLAGILAGDQLTGGSTLVLCNGSIADPPLSTACAGTNGTTSGVMTHNGDDAYDLICGTTVLDTIGQIGFRPSGGWSGGTPTVSTLNMTLRRKCSVTMGDPNGADVFDPSVEWDGFPSNTFDDLGTYSCP